MMIPNIWKNKACSKPPTKYWQMIYDLWWDFPQSLLKDNLRAPSRNHTWQIVAIPIWVQWLYPSKPPMIFHCQMLSEGHSCSTCFPLKNILGRPGFREYPNIPTSHMAKDMVPTYRHFRILKFPSHVGNAEALLWFFMVPLFFCGRWHGSRNHFKAPPGYHGCSKLMSSTLNFSWITNPHL